jgi:hypothetical protein
MSTTAASLSAPTVSTDSGLRGLSIGITAVSPLIALAGKLLKDKFSDNDR